jgi:hypothetical protein
MIVCEKKITFQKVITSNILFAFNAKQYIIAFDPLHLSKSRKHDPITFHQSVAHLRTPILNHLNILYLIGFFSFLL